MPCYHPLPAWYSHVVNESGKRGITFRLAEGFIDKSISLPCGTCIGCRLEHAREWAMRCVHESKLWDCNAFVTLTYNDDNIPYGGSLRYRDFQLFMKRLRKHFSGRKVRFYMCGEYGESTRRPHYHACLFNVGFSDKLYFKRKGDFKLYTSRCLNDLWQYGSNNLIGDVSFQSAAYVARYIMKKVTGNRKEVAYRDVDLETGEIYRRVPEFNRMSLKPGIGGDWFGKYMGDVFPLDHVIVRGSESRPPRYYSVLYGRVDPVGLELLGKVRYERSGLYSADNSDARLNVINEVVEARISKLRRSSCV